MQFGELDHAALDGRHGFRHGLDGQITTSYHDGVGGDDDLLEVCHGGGGFNFCNHFEVGFVLCKTLFEAENVLSGLHKRQCNVVALGLDGKLDVGDIFGGKDVASHV